MTAGRKGGRAPVSRTRYEPGKRRLRQTHKARLARARSCWDGRGAWRFAWSSRTEAEYNEGHFSCRGAGPVTEPGSAVDRTLFWRYKANAQRAARSGDYKYLKLLDNTFLFNVVEDPMERANLKDRRKDVYDRLVAQWHAWNATMLPEVDESSTDNFTGDQLADHIGTPKSSGKAENPAPLPKRPPG